MSLQAKILDREWKILETLADPRLEVLSPFHVEVHRDPDSVTFHDPETEIFGSGATEALALEDFQAALSELFFTLDGDRAALGPALQETLRLLEEKVRKRV